jgi:hypothetical protein
VRTIKILFLIIILGMAGLAGFAYLGDMSPQVQENTVPVAVPTASARDGN